MITALNLPPTIASRYVPVRLIARSGMGVVYEVEHARTGEHLALKVLLSGVGSSVKELERFKREARASAKIKSENVVRVTDADIAPELDGAPFLVMELLEGADLEHEAASTPPSPATVVEWLRQVARALDKAHRLGIVHRDLKPENLFLAKAEDRPPIVKILDFGVAKMIEEGAGATGSGQILGTPKYMAPEQASTNSGVTSAADRYSLGLVAYRLLTGESYYRGDVLSVLAQLLHSPLEPPSLRHSGYGSAFDAWFLRACHRDPEERFSSASEQIEALSAALGLPTIAIQPARETISENGPRSRRMVGAAVLVAAALAATLLAWILQKGRPGISRSGPMPGVAASPEPPAPPLPRPSPPPAPRAPPPAPIAGAETAPAPPVRGSGKPLRTPRRQAPAPKSGAGAGTVPQEEQKKPQAPDPYADQR